MAVRKKTQYAYCISHGRDVELEKFNISKNPNHKNGYLPYCKDCLKDIWQQKVRKMKSFEGACYVMCAEIGVPFKKEIWQAVTKDCENRPTKPSPSFGMYYTKLNALGRVSWTGFEDTNDVLHEVNVATISDNIHKQDKKELEFTWGIQSEEDYEFLIYTFDTLTENVESFENVVHVGLYRKVCLAELEAKKINEGRSSEDYTKVQERIFKLLSKLKLDNFDEQKPQTLSEQTLFAKIALIDENNVIDIYKEPRKFADFNKYLYYIKKFCLRPLGNMLANNKDFDIDITDIEKYHVDD